MPMPMQTLLPKAKALLGVWAWGVRWESYRQVEGVLVRVRAEVKLRE